jgi:hypothetical protein
VHLRDRAGAVTDGGGLLAGGGGRDRVVAVEAARDHALERDACPGVPLDDGEDRIRGARFGRHGIPGR